MLVQPRRFAFVFAASVCALAFGARAEAATKNFMAVMNAGQEVPPLARPGTGNAFLTFDAATDELCWGIGYTDLAGNETATHIHGPASPGVDAPIIVDISPNISPLGSGKQGCATINAETQKALKAGQLYINVHSDAGPAELGGEIRGQIIPVKGK
jgi:hypothetical protein